MIETIDANSDDLSERYVRFITIFGIVLIYDLV